LSDLPPTWVVDASVWVGAYVPADAHHAASRAWLDAHGRAGDLLFEPDLLLVEFAGCVVRRTGDPSETERLVAAARAHPQVRWVALDDSLRDQAAQLAIDLRLRGADAVYVAVAQQLRAPLITWDDEQLSRAGPAVKVRPPGP
jgi:predicted nucleic acid-binding protein